MGAAVLLPFFMPWIDNGTVKSTRYRSGMHKVLLGVFVISFIILGYLGTQPPTPLFSMIARVATIVYFLFFVGLFLLSRFEKTKPVPERVTK